MGLHRRPTLRFDGTEDAPQPRYSFYREVFNGLRWIVRTGAPWRMMPHDLPRGMWSTNKPNVGTKPGCLRPWCTTADASCACEREERTTHSGHF